MSLSKPTRDRDTICLALAISLVLFAISARLLPHPPNFAPIAAVAIFGSFVLPRRLALCLPLAALVISDLAIGLHPLILWTWGSFVLIAYFGSRLARQPKPRLVIAASIGASTLFYTVSNFGVWLQGAMYPMTAAGLIDCYYKALPFFRNTLMGDLAYTAALFGLYSLATSEHAFRLATNIQTKMTLLAQKSHLW